MSPATAAASDRDPGRPASKSAGGRAAPSTAGRVARGIMEDNERLVANTAGLLSAAFDIRMMPSLHRTERRDSLAGRTPRLPVLIVPGFMSSGLVVERSDIKRGWEEKRLWLNLVSLGLGGYVRTDDERTSRGGASSGGDVPPPGSGAMSSSDQEGGLEGRRRPDPPGMRSSAGGGGRRESFASTLRRASVRAVDDVRPGVDDDGLHSPLLPTADGDESDDVEAQRRAEEGAAAEVQSRNTWIKHIR